MLLLQGTCFFLVYELIFNVLVILDVDFYTYIFSKIRPAFCSLIAAGIFQMCHKGNKLDAILNRNDSIIVYVSHN